jgi:hypothetical protein
VPLIAYAWFCAGHVPLYDRDDLPAIDFEERPDEDGAEGARRYPSPTRQTDADASSALLRRRHDEWKATRHL